MFEIYGSFEAYRVEDILNRKYNFPPLKWDSNCTHIPYSYLHKICPPEKKQRLLRGP
jgi:hypothetical protein